jgi:hypothetical protein
MSDRTWELLRTHLDGDFRALPMAPNKCTEKDIKNVEKKLDIKFPEEYRIHLLGEGDDLLGARGIYVEVKEKIWKRPEPLDVGPFWSGLYCFHTYTASKESDDWMRLEIAGRKFMDDTGIMAVPILEVMGDADVYCVNERSEIHIFKHEEGKIEPANMNFWEVLDYELKALRERKERKVNEARKT